MIDDRDSLSDDVIHRIRTYGYQEDAARLTLAWWQHVEMCGTCCFDQSADGALYQLCPAADNRLSAALHAATVAAAARRPRDADDGEEPGALLGQAWRAPVEIPV